MVASRYFKYTFFVAFVDNYILTPFMYYYFFIKKHMNDNIEIPVSQLRHFIFGLSKRHQ